MAAEVAHKEENHEDASNEDQLDRARGCFLGTAVGDSLGTTLEFSTRLNPYKPTVTDIVGKGPHKLRRGQWTDDTSMALCLADSLLSKKRLDLTDQLQRYLRWAKRGHNSCTGTCFDVGTTIRNSLEAFRKSKSIHAAGRFKRTAGNGSLMRIAPVPIAAPTLETAMKWGSEQSKATHVAVEAVQACELLSGMLFLAIEGGLSKDELLNHPKLRRSDWTTKITEIIHGSYRTKEPPEIQGSGYVIHTLEAVLWAFNKSTNFKDGAVLVVNLGNDSDTTGAIYGALAGAFYGLSSIPEKWRKIVAWSEHIQKRSTQLYNARSVNFVSF